MAGGKPTDIDRRIGQRLRQRRRVLGVTLAALGVAMGISYQQVQKFERGTNRIGAAQLYHAAEILEVGIEWFFTDDEA